MSPHVRGGSLCSGHCVTDKEGSILAYTFAFYSQELLYDVHFWIGQHSTQDEYGTAAYKTVELDTLVSPHFYLLTL